MTIHSVAFTRHHLPALCEFTSQLARARWPGPTRLMTSDIAWQLHGSDPKNNLRLFYEDDALMGYAWYQPPWEVIADVAEDADEDVAIAIWQWAIDRRRGFPPGKYPFLDATDMSDWAEVLNDLDQAARDDHKVLITPAFEPDVARVAPPDGFEQTSHGELHLRHDLSNLDAAGDIAIRAIRDDEREAYASAHRDAWGSASTFSAQRLQELASIGNLFDSSLCLVAEVDGEFAGTTIFWADEASGIGNIEPFGVRPAYRGGKVSRALIHGGLRRLRDRGMRGCRVYTTSFNHQAQRLYQSCGFEPSGVSRTWRRNCD